MAQGEQEQIRLQIRTELCRFAEEGQSNWQKLNGGTQLRGIEGLLRARDDLADDVRPETEMVCKEIQTACESLEGQWKNAALTHLGFTSGSANARTNREEEAGACLRGRNGRPISLRAYRATRAEKRHKGRRYDGRTFESWSELTLTLVAEALIAQCGGRPSARTDIGVSNGSVDMHRLGDEVRAELAEIHQPVEPRDFDVSFFHRPSTDAYIELLASLDGVTLYTGGAVSGDVRTPLSDKLMARSLRERLRAETDLTDAQRQRVVGALMYAYPPAFLGSIAREFVRAHSDSQPGNLAGLEAEARNVFGQDLRNALREGRDTGGFLALGLGTLALALRKAGKDPVRVMSTNYDDRIGEAEPRIHEYFSGLSDYSFRRAAPTGIEDSDERYVPLHSLNGQLKDSAGEGLRPLIIGEADALTDYFTHRSRLMDEALTESSCIFIGGAVTEPDVLTKLVNTPYRFPRFAVVLSPELRLENPDERARALNLVAQRFLHLGVVPIFIDFPHQVPQFLIEVALRLQQGKENYENYPTRLENWWASWAKDFGFGASQGKRGGRRNQELQFVWMKELEKIRQAVATKHLDLPAKQRDREEQIQVEVWVRHPKSRSLVLWATSEGVWFNANSAHRCFIHEGDEFAVQRAFREGTPVYGPISSPRGIWRYQLSVPLVLRKHPWYHLPVGVISILSSKGGSERDNRGEVTGLGGKLGTFAERADFAQDLAGLVSDVKGPVNELLDPRSDRCRRKGIGAYSARR